MMTMAATAVVGWGRAGGSDDDCDGGGGRGASVGGTYSRLAGRVCVCVGVCSGGDRRRLAFVSDHRLLLCITGLLCRSTGAAPSLTLGTRSQVLSTNFWLVAAPVAPVNGLGKSVVVALEGATWGLSPTGETGKLRGP